MWEIEKICVGLIVALGLVKKKITSPSAVVIVWAFARFGIGLILGALAVATVSEVVRFSMGLTVRE